MVHHISKDLEISMQTIEAVIVLMGSGAAAARALNVSESTVYRWRSGRVMLDGPAIVAARAVIRHPSDYVRFKTTKADNS